MDDALEQLVQEGTVDGADAYMKAVAKKRFEKYLPEE
jgi:hypothetical protein